MKKILSIILLTTSLAFASFTSPFSAPSSGKLVSADHEYELDTWGSNSELYEFTPRSNPGMSCIMLMLDNSKAMGLQCFPKPGYNLGASIKK